MAEQFIQGGFVRGLELQVGVLDVPYQQALTFQISADPSTDRLDKPFQRPGTGRRQTAKYGLLAVYQIHPV
ncbi:MAG: hypothetical protein MAG794_01762 [Gammaproteobacteria bacterium]|nr:hypothetical protein [Gammaproteobacteria bacterium]